MTGCNDSTWPADVTVSCLFEASKFDCVSVELQTSYFFFFSSFCFLWNVVTQSLILFFRCSSRVFSSPVVLNMTLRCLIWHICIQCISFDAWQIRCLPKKTVFIAYMVGLGKKKNRLNKLIHSIVQIKQASLIFFMWKAFFRIVICF